MSTEYRHTDIVGLGKYLHIDYYPNIKNRTPLKYKL